MEVNRVNYAPPPVPAGADAPAAPVQVEFAQTPAPLTPPVVQPEADHAPETAVQGAQLERAVTELNSSLAIHARHMSIGNHAATGRTMVTVYNTETSEVIREIPPQRVLDAHASLLEMAGLLIDRRG